MPLLILLGFLLAMAVDVHADEAPKKLYVAIKPHSKVSEADDELVRAVAAVAESAAASSGNYTVVRLSDEADVALTADFALIATRRIVIFQVVDLRDASIKTSSRVDCQCSDSELIEPINSALVQLIGRPIGRAPGSVQQDLTGTNLGPDEAELRVVGSPPQASVYLNGAKWGQAPRTFRIQAGRHELSVRREQHADFDTTVTVPAGRQARVDYRLVPWGRLSIETRPHDALMRIDGNLVRGRSFVPVTPSEHRLEFERIGYMSATTTVVVPLGESLTYVVRLDPDLEYLRMQRERKALARRIFVPSAVALLAGAIATGALANSPARPGGVAVLALGVVGVGISMRYDTRVAYTFLYGAGE